MDCRIDRKDKFAKLEDKLARLSWRKGTLVQAHTCGLQASPPTTLVYTVPRSLARHLSIKSEHSRDEETNLLHVFQYYRTEVIEQE